MNKKQNNNDIAMAARRTGSQLLSGGFFLLGVRLPQGVSMHLYQNSGLTRGTAAGWMQMP
ncbi:MAG: hypothetical protein NC307_05295 [Roseburia sp.]|nr:hypothetical protein [Roseburia sp.]